MILVIDIGYQQIYRLTDTIDLYDDFKVVSLYDFSQDALEEFKPQAVIISHGPITVNDTSVQNYLDQLAPLKKCGIPILGIGVGHHLLGLLFHSQAVFAPYINDIITVGVIEIDDPLFNKLPLDIEVSTDHSSSISIPPGFLLLASSDGSINEVMKHKEKPIYGVQFLPERSGNYGAIIIENFVEISSRSRSIK
jgi:GMP synthase (glutamine-hydrolysing)